MSVLTQILIALAVLVSIFYIHQASEFAKTAFESLDQAGKDLSELSSGMQSFTKAEGIRSTINVVNWAVLTVLIAWAMLVVRRDSRKDSKNLASIRRLISKIFKKGAR